MTILIAVMYVVITLGSVHGGAGTSDLPYPFLTISRSAQVLDLVCQPPDEACDWEAVQDLKVLALFDSDRMSGNITLAWIDKSMEEPRWSPSHGISQATFKGTWKCNSASLTFVMPFTDKKLGDYFCTGEYSDKNAKDFTFSNKVAVRFISSHQQKPTVADNFKVSMKDADQVKVTWTIPQEFKLTEASVSRTVVDGAGNDIAPSQTLFITPSMSHSSVLLVKPLEKDKGNYSVTLYVGIDYSNPLSDRRYIRYSCHVVYPACHGEDDIFCTCDHGRQHPDTTRSPASTTYFELFIFFAVLFSILVLIMIPMLVLYCLFKYSKCSERICLKKLFTARQRNKETYKEVPQQEQVGASGQSNSPNDTAPPQPPPQGQQESRPAEPSNGGNAPSPDDVDVREGRPDADNSTPIP